MTREEMEDQKMSIVLMGWSLSMWATLAGGESATLGDCPCIGLAPRPVLLETLEKFAYLEGVCGRIHLLGASWDDEAKWTEAPALREHKEDIPHHRERLVAAAPRVGRADGGAVRGVAGL